MPRLAELLFWEGKVNNIQLIFIFAESYSSNIQDIRDLIFLNSFVFSVIVLHVTLNIWIYSTYLYTFIPEFSKVDSSILEFRHVHWCK